MLNKKAPLKKVFFHVLPFLKKNKWRIISGVSCLILIDAIQLYIPRITKEVIDKLANGTAKQPEMVKYGLLFILFSILVGGFRFLWRWLIIGTARRMERDIRQRFYEHVLSLPLEFFNKTKIGDLMALATNDLDAVRMMFGIGLIASFDAFIWGAAALACMAYISPIHTLYIGIPLPILTVLLLYFGPHLNKQFRKVQMIFANLTDKAQETFSGIRVVKSYVQEEQEENSFKQMSLNYIKANLRLTLIWGMLDPTINLVIGISISLILLLVGKDVLIGNLTMGDFVAFNLYLGLAIWPMIAMGWVVNLVQRGKASMERINEVFNSIPEMSFTEEIKEIDKIKGSIEFRNLTFFYSNSNYPALENLSMKVEPDRTIAIVGRTGSGKTTLVSLLSGLYKPEKGTLFIDGKDITEFDLENLRKQVGVVPQEAFLFSETIIENLLFGKITAARDEALNYAKLADVHNDINAFPEGYETLVGERGITLSGGQKQRVTIARTLLTEPRILVLDDSLSSVDTHTEEAILKNLKEIRRGRTTIIISHRISTVHDADKIFVIDNGRLAEEGTHEQLINLGGIYADMEERQRLEESLA
ncbi:MAG: ABC transporter ATP-binding protein [Candidatus Coatesbacteria bacterium]|nr:ABC transporter ATP-binding protein [Candidatus Coatesbacteria bacterium]